MTAVTHQELYGPGRYKHGRQIKDTLQKCHVLQDGEYNYTQGKLCKDIWNSSAHIDYSHGLHRANNNVTAQECAPNSLQQMESHFRLGNDSGESIPNRTYQISATKEDFNKKQAGKPFVMQENRNVNWPDMAPQYATDRSTGTTEYNLAFMTKGVPRAAPLFPRINTAAVALPINDKPTGNNIVSVCLGSDSKSFETETTQAYNPSEGATGAATNDIHQRLADAKRVTEFMRDMGRNSNVFRKGDYNDHGKEPGSSIFTLDYCKQTTTPYKDKLLISTYNPQSNGMSETDAGNPDDPEDPINTRMDEELVKADSRYGKGVPSLHPKIPSVVQHHLNTYVPTIFKEAAEGRDDHLSAHFRFGMDNNLVASIYEKDFAMADKIEHQKPVISSAPRDSEVLQRDPECNMGSSTATTDFGRKTYRMGIDANADMRRIAEENMMRRHGNNVILTYDKDRHFDDRQASLSKASYIPPPAGFRAMDPRRAPPAMYNYLETDVALPFPVPKTKKTENQYNFSGVMMDSGSSIERRRVKDEQTKSRLDHGRDTHFVFGYDAPPLETEHVAHFQDREPVDVAVPAAGKTDKIPRAKFTHFNQSENTQDVTSNPYAASIGESLRARSLSSSRAMPVLPTHNATVMQNDYQPLHRRKLTEAQTAMIQQNEKMMNKTIAQTHLFHMDQPGSRNFRSTTMADFIKPEQMPGAQTEAVAAAGF